MGAVYLATEAALERKVAIKVLPPDRGATQDSRDRFRREARTAAKLSHPNIVPLYTFGDVGGTLYFVMGYVRGESLAQRLKREGRLPVEESRRILIEIAEALDYAHKLGIIHRDIKPDNVLIEEGTGRAMLMDFGVAKALGAGQTMTEIGSVLGTPQYMSPEQAQGKADIDHRSDLYSLGVMGYAMVAGRLPFDGPTAGDIMVQHITKEPPTLASLASGAPPEITSALTRCLVKNKELRWRDATSLRAALAPPEADETPEKFEGLAMLFRSILAAGFAALLLAAWWFGGRDLSDRFPLLPLAPLAAGAFSTMLLVGRYSQLRKAGFESSRIVREIFRQPEGWPGWYPRRFRRAGDVWDRLPPQLRHARAMMGWMLLTLGLTLPPGMLFGAALKMKTGSGVPNPSNEVALLIWAALLAPPLLVARWRRWARARGLDFQDVNKTVFGPTTKRSFWTRPEIAALLLPEALPSAAGSSPAEPASPLGFAAAVSAIAQTLPEPVRAIGGRAQASARELAESIGAIDKQIAHLAGAFDPEESKRLVDKIAALGPDAGSGDENGEIRDILRKQLETMRALESRLEDVKPRRARRFELLKALWLQSVELQAAAGDAARTGRTTDRIQRLFTQIAEEGGSPKTNRAPSGDSEPLSEAPTIAR